MLSRVIAPVIFGLAGIGVLIALGNWQMRRLDWKQGVLTQIEAKIDAAPLSLDQAVALPDTSFQPTQLQGAILPGELHVLVSRKPDGAGYRVIVPFADAALGKTILLDRGFVRADDKNSARPVMANLTIIGNLHVPDDRNNSTPDNDPDSNIWFARDLGQMAAELGAEPILVVARSATGQGVDPLPISTQGIPNNHLQYAITWYSLAIVWLGMTALLLWRIRRQAK